MGKLHPPSSRNKSKIHIIKLANTPNPMRLYIYYNKRDSSQEPQGKIEAINITDAIKKAAIVKQMDLDTFLQVFGIKTKTNGKIKV
jgi:hypothetical protein